MNNFVGRNSCKTLSLKCTHYYFCRYDLKKRGGELLAEKRGQETISKALGLVLCLRHLLLGYLNLRYLQNLQNNNLQCIVLLKNIIWSIP